VLASDAGESRRGYRFNAGRCVNFNIGFGVSYLYESDRSEYTYIMDAHGKEQVVFVGKPALKPSFSLRLGIDF